MLKTFWTLAAVCMLCFGGRPVCSTGDVSNAGRSHTTDQNAAQSQGRESVVWPNTHWDNFRRPNESASQSSTLKLNLPTLMRGVQPSYQLKHRLIPTAGVIWEICRCIDRCNLSALCYATLLFPLMGPQQLGCTFVCLLEKFLGGSVCAA